MKKTAQEIDIEYEHEYEKRRKDITDLTLTAIAESIAELLQDSDKPPSQIQIKLVLGWIKSRGSYRTVRSLEDLITSLMFEFAKYTPREKKNEPK